MTYESVPERELRQFGNRNALLQFLEENQGKFFKAKDLAGMFGYRMSQSCPELRLIITEFLQQGYPIVATGQGFSWGNKSQILFYISQLQERKFGLERRITSLRKISENMN